MHIFSSYFISSVKLWNALPIEIVLNPSISTFKSSVKHIFCSLTVRAISRPAHVQARFLTATRTRRRCGLLTRFLTTQAGLLTRFLTLRAPDWF